MTEKAIIDKARADGRVTLTEVEAKELIQDNGINVVDTRLATSKKNAVAISEKIGFPVALKITSPDILHKSDAGGVRLRLMTAEQVGEAYDGIVEAVSRNFPETTIHGISVQSMARAGIEVIIGMSKDMQFGPMLMFGLGGVLVEVLKDVSFKLVPLTLNDARKMIKEIKGYALLKGFRGQEPADISFLEDLLLKVSGLVERHPEIKELDLNPVLAYSDGAVVADARVILEES